MAGRQLILNFMVNVIQSILTDPNETLELVCVKTSSVRGVLQEWCTSPTPRWGLHLGCAATAMTQLRDTVRSKKDWWTTICEIHKSQLHDGSYSLHAHEPRDQNMDNKLLHDLLMNEKVWHARVDPERVETDPIIEPRRCVYVRSEISGCRRILDASLKTLKRWSGHGTGGSGAELVTAMLKGLKQPLQDDGLLSINAFESGMTGHDLQPRDEHHMEKVFEELVGASLNTEDLQKS